MKMMQHTDFLRILQQESPRKGVTTLGTRMSKLKKKGCHIHFLAPVAISIYDRNFENNDFQQKLVSFSVKELYT